MKLTVNRITGIFFIFTLAKITFAQTFLKVLEEESKQTLSGFGQIKNLYPY